MRTTIRLDDMLMAQVKRYASKQGKTLTAVIELALRETLSRKPGARPVPPVRLPTVKGRGLRPGLSIDNAAALLDFMERPAK